MSSHALHQMYFHIIWTTKQRMEYIGEDVREWMIAQIQSESEKREATVLACNTMPDHVHLLVNLPPTVLVSAFIGEVKGASSYAFGREYGPNHFLKWQTGYCVLTMRKGDTKTVVGYIATQQERHAQGKLWPHLEQTSDE